MASVPTGMPPGICAWTRANRVPGVSIELAHREPAATCAPQWLRPNVPHRLRRRWSLAARDPLRLARTLPSRRASDERTTHALRSARRVHPVFPPHSASCPSPICFPWWRQPKASIQAWAHCRAIPWKANSSCHSERSRGISDHLADAKLSVRYWTVNQLSRSIVSSGWWVRANHPWDGVCIAEQVLLCTTRTKSLLRNSECRFQKFLPNKVKKNSERRKPKRFAAYKLSTNDNHYRWRHRVAQRKCRDFKKPGCDRVARWRRGNAFCASHPEKE
jgi:hypothetical protein